MNKNERKTIPIFSKIILCLFILFSFHACSFFEDDVKDNSSESSQVQNQEQPGAVITSDEKTLILSFTPYFGDASRTSSRSAYPEFNKTQLAAYSYTIQSEHFSETTGTYDSTNGTINFEINSLTFSEPAEVTVYAKSSGSIVWSANTSITYPTVANPNPVELSLYFQPYTSSTVKGEINLTVSISEGFIVSCEVVNPSASNTVISTTGTVSESTPILLSYSNSNRTCTIETNPSTKIPAGSYTAKIIIKKGSEIRDYLFQTINVWPGITTNRWYLADGDKHDTYTITISEDEKKYYVRAASGSYYGIYSDSLFSSVSSSDSATGTIMQPLATVQYAIGKCTDTSTRYTIICDGNFSSGFSIGTKGSTNTYSSANITIIGAGNNSSALSTFSGAVNVVSSKNVILENIKVSGVTGSGMYFASNTTTNVFTLNNCESSNNKNTDSDGFGGGMLIDSGTTVKLGDGVVISGNEATLGGGIYNKGNLFMYGNAQVGLATMTLPETKNAAKTNGGNCCIGGASFGAGIYNLNGNVYLGYTDATTPVATFTGGIFGNYSENQASGIYVKGGSLNIHGGNINYNNSTGTADGGGVRLSDSATMEMDAGLIKGNKAYGGTVTNPRGLGGGVYIGSNESFTMSGGTIETNEGRVNGGGVYNNGGTFTLSDSAYIPAGDNGKNDVGLATGALIKIGGDLTPPPDASGITATITPSAWNRGSQVLAGDGTNVSSITDEIAAKFAVSDSEWNITADSDVGKLDTGTTIYVSESAITGVTGGVAGDDTTGRGTQKYPYASIQKAALETWKAQDYTISVNGELKATSTGTSVGTGKLQNIPNDTSVKATSIALTGTNSAKINASSYGTALTLNKEISVTITSIEITGGKSNSGGGIKIAAGVINLDSGAKVHTNKATNDGSGAGIYVGNNTALNIKSGSEIYNNSAFSGTIDGGGVYNNGSVNMSGGNVYNNTGWAGGGLYNCNSKVMILSGGSIYSNTATSDTEEGYTYGGGIYNKGTLNITGDVEIYSNNVTETNTSKGTAMGGGIYNLGTGDITISGAIIMKKNSATASGTVSAASYGGGICNYGTLTMSAGSFGSSDSDSNTADSGGAIYNHGIFNISGSVAIPNWGTIGSNDVYVYDGKPITVAGTLSSESSVAIITPGSTTDGTKLLNSSAGVSLQQEKFGLTGTPSFKKSHYINCQGKLYSCTQVTNSNMESELSAPVNGSTLVFIATSADEMQSMISKLKEVATTYPDRKFKVDITQSAVTGNISSSTFTFNGCTNITELILDGNNLKAQASAFASCTSLTTLTITGTSKNITHTGNTSWLSGCSALTTLDLTACTEVEINGGCFPLDNSIQTIKLGNGLIKLGVGNMTQFQTSGFKFTYPGTSIVFKEKVTTRKLYNGTDVSCQCSDTTISYSSGSWN